MFTGIVEGMGTVEVVERRGDGYRLAIRLGPAIAEGVRIGDSIAVSGCCLTVVALDDGDLAAFDAIPETMERTRFQGLAPGARVNLERAMRVGARLDGHLVQGHVDGTARVAARTPEGGPWGQVRFDFAAPARLTEEMVMKGSVAVDGVSLTLIDVRADSFAVAIIPHTLEVTTFGGLAPGDLVNVETDVVGKWILKAARPYLDALKERGT